MPEDKAPVALTARETEVVGLVIKGLSEPEIAARLERDDGRSNRPHV